MTVINTISTDPNPTASTIGKVKMVGCEAELGM
jgi:hypothetical protein